jgi:hypothetical protein
MAVATDACSTRGFATAPPPFVFQDLFELPNKPKTEYRKLTGDHVQTLNVGGRQVWRSVAFLPPPHIISLNPLLRTT